MINKNDYRKINDKKILHKSGKTWKVVSLALLLAIGGGATVAATNANANADATDNAYNDATGVTSATAAQAEQLENNNYYGGSAKASVAPKSASKEIKAPSLANVSYAPSEYYAGNNASAASYKNQEAFDKANINYYGPIVRNYVNQINARYPEAVSLEDNYNDLNGKAINAKSTANSYSATAQNSNTANLISAKASAAHQTTSDYTDSVAYHVLNSANGFMPMVSNDYSLASEESTIASAATLVSNINKNSALSAQYHEKYVEASDNFDAVSAYASDEAQIASNINNNSSANQNDLTTATASYNSLSTAATIARINSGVDASFVNSVAGSAGFSYSSSVVSSAISLLASGNYIASTGDDAANDTVDANDNNPFSNTGLTDAQNYTTYQAKVSGNKLYFKANNQSGVAKEASYIVNSPYNTMSAAVKANVNDTADSYGLQLLQVVSDTAAQQAYASNASSLENRIANDKSAISSYAVQVSSANSAALSANNKKSVAASAENAAAYLNGNGVDLGSIDLANMFGSLDNQSTDVGRAQFDANFTSYVNANLSAANNAQQSAYASAIYSYLSSANTAETTNAEGLQTILANGDLKGKIDAKASDAAALLDSGTADNAASIMSDAVSSVDGANGKVSDLQSAVNKSVAANTTAALSASNPLVQAFASIMTSEAISSAVSTTHVASNSAISASGDAFENAMKQSFSNNTTTNLKGYADASNAETFVNSSAANVPATYIPNTYVGNSLFNANSYSAAINDHIKDELAAGNDSLAVSEVNSTAASAGSAYNSVSSASASYAKATDQDVTIASQFTSYYNSVASVDATSANDAKASLDNFRDTHASNPQAYTSASQAYAKYSASEPNDRDFAYAYGKNVLLNTPEYITVTKNAMLHNDTQYAKSNSVESVKAGDQFAVKGVGFDLAGNVRYVVADHKGENLYLTANDEYVRNTYLAPSIDYTVTLAKPAVAHSTLGFVKDAKGTIPANTQLEGYTVPTSTNSGRRDAAYGVTRLQVKGGKFNGDYITTNGKYFSNVTENSSNNAQANAQDSNPVQHTINFAD